MRMSNGIEDECKGIKTYSSGSFWKSAMAARGIPKLEAGPQKSECAPKSVDSACQEGSGGKNRVELTG